VSASCFRQLPRSLSPNSQRPQHRLNPHPLRRFRLPPLRRSSSPLPRRRRSKPNPELPPKQQYRHPRRDGGSIPTSTARSGYLNHQSSRRCRCPKHQASRQETDSGFIQRSTAGSGCPTQSSTFMNLPWTGPIRKPSCITRRTAGPGWRRLGSGDGASCLSTAPRGLGTSPGIEGRHSSIPAGAAGVTGARR